MISDENDCVADSSEGISLRRVLRALERDESVEVRPVVVWWSDRKVG